MPRALLVASVFALALLSAPGLVRADAPHASPSTSPPPPPTPPPAPWRALYHAGSVAYDAGRLDEALADFRGALDQGGPATLHYDIALTLDRLGRAAEAIAAYRRYLDAVPDASNRDVVEARLVELQPPSGAIASTAPPSAPILALVAPDATASAPTTTTTSSDAYLATHAAPTRDHWEQQGPEWTVSWVMLALTAATSVATVLVWNDGLGHFQQLQDLCASPMGCTATDIAESSAHTSQDATNALLGVSIGLGALTVLTFIVEGAVTGSRMRFVRGDARRGDPVRFGLGPFGVSLSGTF